MKTKTNCINLEKIFTSQRGSVFIYIIMVMTIFMMMFTTIIFLVSRNLSYTMESSTKSKLAQDSSSHMNKIVGLFQRNPQDPDIVTDSQKRDIDLLAYTRTIEGYVYKGKTDVLTIDSRQYVQTKSKPKHITITNESISKEDMTVIFRKINRLNNYVLGTITIPIEKDTSISSKDGKLFELLDGKPLSTFLGEYVLEMVVYSEKENGAIYTVKADTEEPDETAKGWLVKNNFTVSITSYEDLKSLGSGLQFNRTATSFIEYPTLHAASFADFAENESQKDKTSSTSFPGVSPAYIDTFDIESTEDWTKTPTNIVVGDGIVTLNQDDTYELNREYTGDFDVRVKIANRTAGPNPFGIYAKINGTTYYTGVKTANLMESTGAKPTPTCTKVKTASVSTYVSYTTTPPPSTVKDANDTSTECANLPFYYQYNPIQTYFFLRFVRSNGYVESFYCEGTESDCDPSEGNAEGWISSGKLGEKTGSATFGLFNKTVAPMVVDYFRATNLITTDSPFTYEKEFHFGTPTPIKKIQLDAFIPSTMQVETTLTYEDNEQTKQQTSNSLVFSPKDTILTDWLNINMNISLQTGQTMTGELSSIPFVRGFGSSYNTVSGMCVPKTICETSCTDGTCGEDGCGGKISCTGSCENTCTKDSKQCKDGANTPQICSDTNDDGCLEWNDQDACNPGWTCTSGECVQTQCIVTYSPTKESLGLIGWTKNNVIATPSIEGQDSYTFTDNGIHSWSGTRCNAEVTWIDKTAPTCNITYGGYTPNTWTNQNVTATAECTDSQSGCKNDAVSQTFTNQTTQDGTTHAFVSVQDKVGNTTPQTNCTTESIKIDKTAPEILNIKYNNQTSPTQCYDGSVSITATVTDSLSGLHDTEGFFWSIQNSSSCSDTSPTWSYDKDASFSVSTSGTLCLKAKDKAGNIKTVTGANISIGSGPSNLSITPSPALPACTTSVTFTANVTGATSYEWYNGTTRIPNATSNAYTTSTIGTYKVVAINTCGRSEQTVTWDYPASQKASCSFGTGMIATISGSNKYSQTCSDGSWNPTTAPTNKYYLSGGTEDCRYKCTAGYYKENDQAICTLASTNKVLFSASYDDLGNSKNADYAQGTNGTNAIVNGTSTVLNGALTLIPGAGNFVSYNASGNIETEKGKIEMVVNGADLKQAGYSYLFDMQKDGNKDLYTDRLSIYKDSSGYLMVRLWDSSGNWMRSRFTKTQLDTLTNSDYTLGISWSSTGNPILTLGVLTPEITNSNHVPVISTSTYFFIGSQVGGAQGKGYVCPPYNDPNATCNVQYQYPIKSVKILSQ